jgi:hypothetical protein
MDGATLLDKPLTDQQARFVLEYGRCLNATQAALRAGYAPATAKDAHTQILQVPAVYRAVARRSRRKVKKLELSEEQTHQRWTWLASFDPASLVDPVTGLGRRLTELAPHVRYCLEAWELDDEGRLVKVKVLNKMQALEKLSKLFQLARDPLAGQPELAAGVTVNHTEIFLQGLSTEELRVMEKILTRTENARAQAERTRQAVAALPPSTETPSG